MENIENDIEFKYIKNLEFAKQELLNILKTIDEIFDNNKIDYWIDAGTLLGAYRNNGFIPWDDDIDISVNKKDYLRACYILNNYTKKHKDYYLLYKPITTKQNCNYFGSKSKYLPLMKNNNYNLIKVDIRPINFIVNNEKQRKRAEKRRNLANIFLYNKNHNNDVKMENILRLKYIRYLFKPIFILIYNLLYIKNSNKDKLIGFHPYYEYSTSKYIDYDIIYPLKKIEFENINVNSPNNIKEYLSLLYDDFEQLPEKSKRCPDAVQYDKIENDHPKIERINQAFRKIYKRLYEKDI
jgi:lipopolysaccharide cholinephosphotransferase